MRLVRERQDHAGPRLYVASSTGIPLLCSECRWQGSRLPKVSCKRCGSPDVNETPVDGLNIRDLGDAQENPETAAWGYVDKSVFRC